VYLIPQGGLNAALYHGAVTRAVLPRLYIYTCMYAYICKYIYIYMCIYTAFFPNYLLSTAYLIFAIYRRGAERCVVPWSRYARGVAADIYIYICMYICVSAYMNIVSVLPQLPT